MTKLPSISVADLAALDEPLILDVREPHEVALCSIAESITIPMGTIAERWEELPADRGPIYCLCHHGMRSAMVADFLRQRGLDAHNVSGGIDTWAQGVDPSMTRY